MHHLMSCGKYECLPAPQVREMAISFKNNDLLWWKYGVVRKNLTIHVSHAVANKTS
jgi:hypothetical protein